MRAITRKVTAAMVECQRLCGVFEGRCAYTETKARRQCRYAPVSAFSRGVTNQVHSSTLEAVDKRVGPPRLKQGIFLACCNGNSSRDRSLS